MELFAEKNQHAPVLAKYRGILANTAPGSPPWSELTKAKLREALK